jgi:predicted GTPase
MSLSKLAEKRLFLIGPMGAGKSETGNTLTNGNNFTVGLTTIARTTINLKIESHQDGLTIGDFPGLIYLFILTILI